MAAVDMLNSSGEAVSKIDLPDDIFCVPVKKSVLHDVVRYQLVARREGTAASKTRGMVSGSTRKLFRQKGTGNARAGSIKSPLRRSGGVIFGPSPRSYEIKIPKRVRKLALKMALSSKFETNRLFVVDDLKMDEVKTNLLAQTLEKLNLKEVLIVSDEEDARLSLSSRNIPKVTVMKTPGLNVYDILKHKNLLLLKSSLENIQGRFA